MIAISRSPPSSCARSPWRGGRFSIQAPNLAAEAISRSACTTSKSRKTRSAPYALLQRSTPLRCSGLGHRILVGLASIVVYPLNSPTSSESVSHSVDPKLDGDDIGYPAMLRFLPQDSWTSWSAASSRRFFDHSHCTSTGARPAA